MSSILFTKAESFQFDYKTKKTIIPFTLSDNDFFANLQESDYNLIIAEKKRKEDICNRIKNAMNKNGYYSYTINFRTMTISVDSPLEVVL